MVEWLAHVFLICDIPDLILGPETLYILTEVFCGFPQFFQENVGIGTCGRFLPHRFRFIIH